MAENSIAAQATGTTPPGNPGQAPANQTPGAKPGETPSQTQTRLFKVKIDGEEREVPEDILIRDYQLREASQSKMTEAAKMRQQAEEALKLIKGDTKEALRRLGIDPYEFAQRVAAEQIEDEMLSPEQKEMRDTKKQLAEFQREKELREQEARNQELQTAQANYVKELQPKLIDTAKSAKLPVTGTAGARTFMRFGEYMSKLYEQGYTGVEPKDVVDLVVNDYKTDIKELLGAGDDDLISSILGDDLMKRISGTQLKRIQNASPNNKVPPGAQKNKAPGKKKEKTKDPGSFFDRVREQYGR
jgi:hypothetical protein